MGAIIRIRIRKEIIKTHKEMHILWEVEEGVLVSSEEEAERDLAEEDEEDMEAEIEEEVEDQNIIIAKFGHLKRDF